MICTFLFGAVHIFIRCYTHFGWVLYIFSRVLSTFLIAARGSFSECHAHFHWGKAYFQWVRCTFSMDAIHFFNRWDIYFQWVLCTFSMGAMHLFIECYANFHLVLISGYFSMNGPYNPEPFSFQAHFPRWLSFHPINVFF